MAYDAAGRQVVLFGGYQVLGQGLGDTWTWNGTDWREQHPSTNPPVVVRFGGKIEDTSGGTQTETVTNETWLWDGATWALVPRSGAAPAETGSVVFGATEKEWQQGARDPLPGPAHAGNPATLTSVAPRKGEGEMY